MMIQKQLPLSLYNLAVLTSLLLLMTAASAQFTNLTRDKGEDCTNRTNFFSTYDEDVIPGFKVLDAVKAQKRYIGKTEVSASILQ